MRALFPGLSQTIYLNTANMAVGCTPAREAYERTAREWSEGRFDWMAAEQLSEELRARFATLIGAETREVAFTPAVAAAAGTVAAQLPRAKPGENILVGDMEFTSNYFSWRLLEQRGYEIRLIATTAAGMLPAEAFAAQADGGTRLIAVSAVQSSNGYRADLAALRAIASRSNAWLFVDACQATGAVRIDVHELGIDFLATSSYKYLLGSRGGGYLYLRQDLLDGIQPIYAGWRAARRPLESFYAPEMELSRTATKLDLPYPWFAVDADHAALGVLARIGHAVIHERNAQLIEHLYARLDERGIRANSFAPAERSTIVSLPLADPQRAVEHLREAGVVASIRAGRVRLSVHFYNTEEEIDRAIELIASA